MRRWLLDLHLYLGLLCLPYVVVFGLSSILLNHGLQRATKTEWSAQIAPPADAAPAQRAAEVLHALALTGNVLPHTLKSTDGGALAFQALRPGRSYQVEFAPSGAVRVAERDGGVLGIVRALHGLHDTQSSRWMLGWALYTELTTAMLLFSIASGVLMVLQRMSGRALALGAGALGTAAAVALGAAIW
jgi:hypothetical protein